jgi:hypothetical protein
MDNKPFQFMKTKMTITIETRQTITFTRDLQRVGPDGEAASEPEVPLLRGVADIPALAKALSRLTNSTENYNDNL